MWKVCRLIPLVTVTACVFATGLSGCVGSNDAAVRTELSDLSVFLAPGDEAKPIDSVNLTMVSDLADFDKAIDLIGQLKAVKTINAEGTALKDKHLEVIGGMSSLVNLVISKTAITDAGMAHLTNARKLINLSVMSTAISGEGLAQIANIKSLSVLNISDTKVDGDLSQLSSLPHLNRLIANGLTSLEDSWAESLAKLPDLTRVQILDSGVSDASVQRLRKAKTGITIE